MKTWVKLYTEIVRDAKIGRLSWAERGMWMIMMALAGDIDHRDDQDNETGELGTPEEVAWHLRCPLTEFTPVIAKFTELGMVHQVNGVLVITHYPKRQDALTNAERARQYRQARGKREYYGDVSKPSQPDHEPVTTRDGESESESESESETDSSTAGAVEPPAAPTHKGKREPKTANCPKEFQLAILELCGITPETATKAAYSQAAQAGAALIRAGASAATLQIFREKWLNFDWRGARGQPPTISQLRNEWQTIIHLERGSKHGATQSDHRPHQDQYRAQSPEPDNLDPEFRDWLAGHAPGRLAGVSGQPAGPPGSTTAGD